MPFLIPYVPLITAAAAAGGATASVISAVKGGEKAKEAQVDQRTRQQNLEAELAARNRSEGLERESAQAQARTRQRQQALSALGRGRTILTGPFGIAGGAAGVQKTLLGL